MGQVFQNDNIPTLSVASTTSVQIAATNMGQPTRLTVGGQQYQLSSTLTLSTAGTGANGLDTGSIGANQLWYVYGIVNQSTLAVALVASLTAPSTGPAIPSGYGAAFKQVGYFETSSGSLVVNAASVTTSSNLVLASKAITYFTNSQALTNGSGVVLTPATITADVNGDYNSSNGRFTVKQSGYYLIIAKVRVLNGSSNDLLAINKNGSRYLFWQVPVQISPTLWGSQVSGILQLNAGEYASVSYTANAASPSIDTNGSDTGASFIHFAQIY